MRRDHADYFCTVAEGLRGKRAEQWKLIDELVPRSKFSETVEKRALEISEKSTRPLGEKGIELTVLFKELDKDSITYENISISLDRQLGIVYITIKGPSEDLPMDPESIATLGDKSVSYTHLTLPTTPYV